MKNNFFGSPVRQRIFFVILIGFFAILIFQLFNMQVLEYYKFNKKAGENSIKKVIKPAPRGIFFDRNHNVLVSNKASFTIQILPYKYKTKLNGMLEKVLGLRKGFISKLLRRKRNFSKYVPINIKRDANFKIISWYEENSEKLPGVQYAVKFQRDYSFGIRGSHIFGYISEISADQLKKLDGTYEPGDYIGVVGLEKEYEKYLRGKKGYNFVVVNYRGKIVRKFDNGNKDVPSQKGDDLLLTLDKKTQIEAEKDFVGKKGALVALNPKTGGILAFVSSPQYNLSIFNSVISYEVLDSLNKDPDKPLFNRATMSNYPPGSTYKMVLASAALDEKIITTSYTVDSKGGLWYGNRFFGDHVHGIVNVVSAIQKSCNTFFYTMILKIGLPLFDKYSYKFGFGRKTGIDIPDESPGFVPTVNYYNKLYGKGRWTNGNIISLGIGQGELGVTPVQLAQYAALLANSGTTKTPHFVKSIIDNKTGKIVNLKYKTINAGISKNTMKIIRQGMYDVVNKKGGTATDIRMSKIIIAGKTGTAQNPHGKDHAVFIAFAPFNNPKIAVAVIVENAGYGALHAAPIAQDIIKTYFGIKQDKPDSTKNLIKAITH